MRFIPTNFMSTLRLPIDYLVVAGGGAGGGFCGGGGGAGGFISGSLIIDQSYEFTGFVGDGGTGSEDQTGQNGEDTTLQLPSSLLTSIGGGGGARGYNTAPYTSGSSGGSGGGSGITDELETNGGGLGTSGQGFKGGNSTGGATVGTRKAAGGGGASEQGQDYNAGSRAGNGGDGKEWLDGTFYAGGGGGSGCAVATSGTGGNGGGGSGNYIATPQSGTDNTGGGGGGSNSTFINGTKGGSGICILRYEGSPRTTGGTIVEDGGFTYHKFLDSGSFSITIPVVQ